jgi:hypothetical protein
MNADLATHRNRKPRIIEFRRGLELGSVDRDKGVIKDVALITAGVQARGHDLHVDDTTLEQINKLATELGQVPVKWNHKTGADSVNGYLSNFRVVGNKTKGDWHLLRSHSQYEQALELAERMPGNVGLSVAFVAAPAESKGGKKYARVEELLSVDLVAQPAANPDGLFDVPVDTTTGRNMNEPTNTAAGEGNANAGEPTLAELFDAIKGLSESVGAVSQRLEAIEAAGKEDKPLTLDELETVSKLSDKELADLGITRAEVDNAVAAAMSGQVTDEGVEAGGGEGANAGEGGEGAAAAAAGGTGSGGIGGLSANHPLVVEMNRLRTRITNFERAQTLARQREEGEAIEEIFEGLEAKVTELTARNEALETAFTAGGGKVTANGEFVMPEGEGGGGGEKTEFEKLVDDRVSKDTREVSLASKRAAAIKFVQGNNRKAYEKHLEGVGVKATHFGE